MFFFNLNQILLFIFFLFLFGLKHFCLSSIFKFNTKFGQFENGIEKFGWIKHFEISNNLFREKNTAEIMNEMIPKEEENQPKNNEKGKSVELINNLKETNFNRNIPDGISFLVEGIEQSDFGISKLDSDYQRSRSRPAIGFRQCGTNSQNNDEPSIIKMYYKSQKTQDNYESEAIRALCYSGNGKGMANFCACDEAGICFTPLDPPIYAELAPYCDPVGRCHIYLELYKGILHAEHNSTQIYTHRFDAGPFGHGSPYMKVRGVSCGGCARIGSILRGNNENDECQGEFVENGMDKQNLRGVLFNEN